MGQIRNYSVLDNRNEGTGRGRALGRLKICLLFLFITGIVSGQEIRYNADKSVDIHFTTVEAYERFKIKIINVFDEVAVKDSVIQYSLKPAIVDLQKKNKQADSSILYLNKRLESCEMQQNLFIEDVNANINKQTVTGFKWEGLSAGLRTGYLFSDSTFSKNSFVNSITDNISIFCRGAFRINKIIFSGFLDIPFAKSRRTGVMFDVGYIFL